MPPQTRMTTVLENRILRSKKVHFAESVRISLSRCDNTNGLSRSRSNNSPKKNIVNRGGKTSNSRSNPKPKEKQKASPSPTKKKLTTISEEKSLDKKKSVAVKLKNDTRKLNLKASLPSVAKADKQSPKKPATLDIVKHKQSSTKTTTTTTNKDTSSKSEIRIKKPAIKKDLSKEIRLRKQMKLGRIFIKPTFPIKTIIKRQIHSGDVEENQGQFVTTDSTQELNNNIVKRTVQPKIVLRKIDHQAGKPVRNNRKTLRNL